MSPRLIRGIRDGRVQVKQKLVGKTLERWRLPKCKPHPQSLLDPHTAGFDRLVLEQSYETRPPRVRPQVSAQKIAQIDAQVEGGLALPDPLEDAVPPLPVLNERQIL